MSSLVTNCIFPYSGIIITQDDYSSLISACIHAYLYVYIYIVMYRWAQYFGMQGSRHACIFVCIYLRVLDTPLQISQTVFWLNVCRHTWAIWKKTACSVASQIYWTLFTCITIIYAPMHIFTIKTYRCMYMPYPIICHAGEGSKT